MAVSPAAAGSSGTGAAAAAAAAAAGKTLPQDRVILKETQAGDTMRKAPSISSPF